MSERPSERPNGEKRILYWLLGAAFSLIMAGLGWHSHATSQAISELRKQVYELALEVKAESPR